jgi:hypothetical protein
MAKTRTDKRISVYLPAALYEQLTKLPKLNRSRICRIALEEAVAEHLGDESDGSVSESMAKLPFMERDLRNMRSVFGRFAREAAEHAGLVVMTRDDVDKLIKDKEVEKPEEERPIVVMSGAQDPMHGQPLVKEATPTQDVSSTEMMTCGRCESLLFDDMLCHDPESPHHREERPPKEPACEHYKDGDPKPEDIGLRPFEKITPVEEAPEVLTFPDDVEFLPADAELQWLVPDIIFKKVWSGEVETFTAPIADRPIKTGGEMILRELPVTGGASATQRKIVIRIGGARPAPRYRDSDQVTFDFIVVECKEAPRCSSSGCEERADAECSKCGAPLCWACWAGDSGVDEPATALCSPCLQSSKQPPAAEPTT